jgi:hypothetical protein
MNFTKEYITECDCEDIQGLRKKYRHGDRLIEKGSDRPLILLDDGRVQIVSPRVEFPKMDIIWLPLSHQLDEEIAKFLEEDGSYEIYFWRDSCTVKFADTWSNAISKGRITINVDEPTPLIAKIQLLKQLLKEQS